MANNIFRRLTSTPTMMAVFDDVALVQAMLDFERALATAEAENGVIETAAAGFIGSCCDASYFDLDDLSEQSVPNGTVVVPLVRQLTKLVADKDKAASDWVHYGATSQDVIDTAMVLQLKKALSSLEADIRRLASALNSLADRNEDTVMIGRTLLQPAVPITFGQKVLGWRSAILRNWERIETAGSESFVLQLGGAAGNLSALGDKAVAVAETCSKALDLRLPDSVWHVHRDRLVAFCSSIAILVGSLGKIATDVSLLMQPEVGEVFEPFEPGRGGSSAMPHKRNPVGCLTALTASKRVPHLVAILFDAMPQEHERALGGWQAEWMTIPAIMEAAAGSLAAMADVAEGMEVNPDAMGRNLTALKGLVMSERVVSELSERIGREDAVTIVTEACREAVDQECDLTTILMADGRIKKEFSTKEINELMSPESYLGTSSLSK